MKKFLLINCLALVAFTAQAQNKKIIADKIAGQVGDKIILLSDIKNAIADIQRQGGQIPENAECQLMEAMLIQKALVTQAEKDSLPVSDEEIDALLDNQVRGFIAQYGSKEVVEEIAGKSIFQLKEDLRDGFKERKLAEQMKNKITENIRITPNEVKQYFDKIPKDSLPYYESELEIGEIVMYPKSAQEIVDYRTSELYNYKRQVESGSKKFDALAKLYSQEPAAKQTGGELTINRTEKNIDADFLRAAFKLKEGQISPVIKTKFGLHIIQMVSRAGDEAIVRHIILIPEVGKPEIDSTTRLMDSVRNLIVKKDLDFSKAVDKFTEDENGKFTGGMIMNRDGTTYNTLDQLDKNIIDLLKGMNVGDVSKPQSFVDERGKQAVRIITLKSRSNPHIENLKEDFSRVSARALEEKKNNTLDKWFAQHIPTYYILIDPEFRGCPTLTDWEKAMAKN